jgi:hypothetical protein
LLLGVGGGASLDRKSEGDLRGGLGRGLRTGAKQSIGSEPGEDSDTEIATGEEASWLAILQKVGAGYTGS